ncbi:hypothetical protein LC55x_3782 [Lysobacter capsici]|nr:hypothetical protein LC55x_3782 [Lysobacter capsici]
MSAWTTAVAVSPQADCRSGVSRDRAAAVASLTDVAVAAHAAPTTRDRSYVTRDVPMDDSSCGIAAGRL